VSDLDPGPPPLTGQEPFDGLDATVIDFWRWAMSDLRMNNVRGYLAEFLVARAVGSAGIRIEWDSHDVTAPDGTRIEVKTTGGIQAWEPANPPRPKWSGLRARTWSPVDGYSAEASYNADVYVLCHHTATTRMDYRALDTSQWDFYVMSQTEVAATGWNSMKLSTVRRLSGGKVGYPNLTAAIMHAARQQTRLAT
jgi:hypothetical protein